MIVYQYLLSTGLIEQLSDGEHRTKVEKIIIVCLE